MTTQPSLIDARHLPPHDHTIEPGEVNRRGCRRCEIDRTPRPLTTLRVQETNRGWWVYDYENHRVLADELTKTEALHELARLVNAAHEEARNA